MTLLDVVMAHAARSILAEAEADMGCVTIEMKPASCRPPGVTASR
jgi:hypothetical protein